MDIKELKLLFLSLINSDKEFAEEVATALGEHLSVYVGTEHFRYGGEIKVEVSLGDTKRNATEYLTNLKPIGGWD